RSDRDWSSDVCSSDLREPSLRGKIRLIQVVVPSRTKVASYELYRRQLDEMVGRINAAHATVNSVPIHYLYRSISEQQLVALYRRSEERRVGKECRSR